MRLASLFVLLLPSLASAAPTLYVAGDAGVREVGLDGATVRTISKTPAHAPRLMPDGKSLIVLRKGEVVRLSLPDGKETVVAKLPADVTVCEKVDPDKTKYAVDDLAVQEESDFVVDASGNALCLDLKNRNVNMLDVALGVHVDLAKGKVTTAISFPFDCATTKLPECKPAASPPEAKPAPGAYDVDAKGWLMKGKTKVARLGPDFSTEKVSPSGKWAVIAGNLSEGDYFHKDLYLLDRTTGAVWNIDEKPVAIKKLKGLQAETVGAVGESQIRWLSDEKLLVDSALITPGVGLVQIEGDIAP